GPGRAEAGLQGGRLGDGGQLLADLRRRGRGAADVAREGRRAGADTVRADLRCDHGWGRPGDHAHRPDPRHAAAAAAQRHDDPRAGVSVAVPDLKAPSELMRVLDIEFDELGPSLVRGSIAADERHHQPWGVVHGGLYTTAFATSGAVEAVKDRGQLAVGVTN